MRITVLATAVLALSVFPRAAQNPELALGLIRPDGILMPFAVFDGQTWKAAWPEPQDQMLRNTMIEHIPSYWREHQLKVPLTWHVVRPGQPVMQVNVLGHVVFGEHCEQQVGLLTDMHPRREVDSMPDARMLATDRPAAIGPGGAPVKVPRPPNSGHEWTLTLKPLGTLKAGTSTFRIVLEIGYEGESIAVMQVGADGEREVLRTVIGGC